MSESNRRPDNSAPERLLTPMRLNVDPRYTKPSWEGSFRSDAHILPAGEATPPAHVKYNFEEDKEIFRADNRPDFSQFNQEWANQETIHAFRHPLVRPAPNPHGLDFKGFHNFRTSIRHQNHRSDPVKLGQ